MHLEFKEVVLKRYGSHMDTIFQITSGRHLITGRNGMGKSTIMEALTASIYKTTRFKDPSFNHEGNALVKTKLNVDGTPYEIRRYWNPSDKVKSPQIYRDEEELGFRRATDTEKEIQRIINLPYDLFSMIIVVMQGLPSNFASMGATVRKTLMEQLFGDAIWDSYRKAFSDTLKGDQTESNDITFKYRGEREKMIALNSRIETAKEYKGNTEDEFRSDIIKLKKDMIEADRLVQEYKLKYPTEIEEGRELQLGDSVSKYNEAMNNINRRKQELEKVLSTGNCYACEREFPQVLIESSRKESDHLDGKLTEVEKRHQVARAELNTHTQIIHELNLLSSKFSQSRMMLDSKATNKPKEAIDYSIQEKELVGVTDAVNGLNETMKSIESSLESLKYIDGLLKPSSSFRTESLRDRIGCINEIITAITPMLFGNIECVLSLSKTGLEIDLKRDGDKLEYKEFSGGEKRRIDLILIFSFQKFIQESSGVSSNLLVFDEIFDNLDAEGVESTLSCIESLFPEASCIYIITHQQNIKSQFNSIIEVTNEGGISHVRQTRGS